MPTINAITLESRLLRNPVEFWTGETQTSFDELPGDAFRPLTDDRINQGITDREYWLRFRVSNTDNSKPVRWVLHHETSYLDEITVYYSEQGQAFEKTVLSDRQPFNTRPVDYRTLAFEHTTAADNYTDVYLRLRFLKADSMSLNLRLSRADIFYDNSRKEYFLYGIYYGLMGSLLIIALIFSSLLRQKLYLYYATFLAASILMWALLNGFAFQYIWPNSIYWQNEGFHIIFLVMAISALQFSRHFLLTRKCCPGADRAVRVLQWTMFGGIFLRLVGFYAPVLYLSYVSLSLLILLPFLGYVAYRNGIRYARWYGIAWSIYALSLIVSVLSAGTTLINLGMQPLVFTQLGGMLESVFLLIALGERLLGWERDRLYALDIANKDPLTGLGNRRALDTAIHKLENQTRLSKNSVFLLMIDLDNFKEINDQHGHEAGDCILKHLASMLKRLCRAEDVCVRYGGEEFAILIQVPDIQQAYRLAERIRYEFAATPTQYDDARIHHTLTIGVGQPATPGAGIDQVELLRQADAALYRAKQAGRNQTLIYT